jgi:hypothetical protein
MATAMVYGTRRGVLTRSHIGIIDKSFISGIELEFASDTASNIAHVTQQARGMTDRFQIRIRSISTLDTVDKFLNVCRFVVVTGKIAEHLTASIEGFPRPVANHNLPFVTVNGCSLFFAEKGIRRPNPHFVS